MHSQKKLWFCINWGKKENPSTPSVMHLKEFSCSMVCSTWGKNPKQLSVNVSDLQNFSRCLGEKKTYAVIKIKIAFSLSYVQTSTKIIWEL